ncbi:MAG: hypothetical protein ACM3ML_06925 [Micromonosporaceae bacterium]
MTCGRSISRQPTRETPANTVAADGGEILVPAADVGESGTMAVISDAVGARIGIWQAAAFHGFSVLGEAGTPRWFELHTRDYQARPP